VRVLPRILIVEDEALIALLLERQLKSLGCPGVSKTARGEDAVASVDREAYDLILMDIHLAGAMDGIEATRLILSRAEAPLIAFMTAFGDRAIREAAMSLDPLAFMEKPLTLDNLKAVIHAWGISTRNA
jgi:CheY-like chemotaxis protein